MMNHRMIIFFFILFLLMLYSLYKALQIRPKHKRTTTLITIFFFIFMLGGTFLYRNQHNVFEQHWFIILSWIGAVFITIWSTFVLFSLPIDLIRLITMPIKVDQSRRNFLFRGLNTTTLAVSGTLAGAGLIEVVHGPQVKETKIKIKNLPKHLEGLKIAQISDLHVGPTIRQGYVEDVVAKTNQLNPDLIFFTGDIADAYIHDIDNHLQPLANLKSKYGKFYITGNHEYYWGVEDFVKKMRELKFTPLINQNKIISIGKTKVMIAGVTDPAGEMQDGHKPDISKAMQDHNQAKFKILLAHRPDSTSFQAEKLGFNLQFSGHTHNGQYFPFNMLIGLFQKYTKGLYQIDHMQLYVNPGTGYWGPASRLGVESEISLIMLVNG